ncbi:MAG: phosphoglucosamine mutase [Chloroflexota bacterium]
MTKLFGTDGIRGVANVDLQPKLAFDLGRATASRLVGAGGSLLLGQDTRRSGDMFAAAVAAGALSLGADVYRLGVCPTPALAHLTATGQHKAGIMVSASHNPARDNGLKVVDERGLKLDDPVEDELEALIFRADELAGPDNAGLGREVNATDALEDYVTHRLAIAARCPSSAKVVLDCANGSAGAVAPRILEGAGASVDARFNEPDGLNINLDCGATVPQALARIVAQTGADVGFALDGDADRCVAVDEHGRVVDGDQLIGVIALDRLSRGALANGIVVASVLSNGGLEKAVTAAGGSLRRTPVGDKYILDGMLVTDAQLGGEKSGHIIVREYASAGDGIVTALEVLAILARSGKRLSELAAQIPLFPQQQRAIAVRHKDQWEADPTFARAVEDAQRSLTNGGRLLVRPSGTESALRIMVEGEDEAQVAALADSLAALAAERLN